MLWVGKNCGQNFLHQVLGVENYALIPPNMVRHLIIEIVAADTKDFKYARHEYYFWGGHTQHCSEVTPGRLGNIWDAGS